MQLRILVFFAALNVLVLSSGFFALDYLDAARQAKARKAEQAQRAAAIRAATPPAPPQVERPKPIVKTVIITQTNQLDWSSLESSDYREYIANLRSVGCPEATIRDIIMTDVMRLYAQRRGQLHHNGREFKFWETDEKRKVKYTEFEQVERQLTQIDKELPAVLRELLGVNYEREVDKYFLDTGEDERRLAFLSEDKRGKLLDLRDKFEGLREKALANADPTHLTPGQVDALNTIETQRREALARVLTPEERALYELSTSATADRLRNELTGFNPTEKEFREIYERQQAIDAKYEYADSENPAVSAAKAADQASMEAELKTLLGNSRMEQFAQSKDADYRSIWTFAEEYDLPRQVAEDVVEMRTAVLSERQALLNNPDITPERRLQALKQIQDETQRQYQKSLGLRVYKAYIQGPGAWINSLAP